MDKADFDDFEITDENFEEMLEMAVKEAYELKMASIPRDEELERLYPFSERHNKRMEKLLEIKKKRKPIFKPRIRYAFASILIFIISVASFNDYVRGNILRFFIGQHENFVRITGNINSEVATEFTQWRPAYVPEMFTEVYEFFAFDSVALVRYYNPTNPQPDIMFQHNLTENIQATVWGLEYRNYRTEVVNGVRFEIFESTNINVASSIVYWDVDGVSFSVTAFLPVEEILKIALSVQGIE